MSAVLAIEKVNKDTEGCGGGSAMWQTEKGREGGWTISEQRERPGKVMSRPPRASDLCV